MLLIHNRQQIKIRSVAVQHHEGKNVENHQNRLPDLGHPRQLTMGISIVKLGPVMENFGRTFFRHPRSHAQSAPKVLKIGRHND